MAFGRTVFCRSPSSVGGRPAANTSGRAKDTTNSVEGKAGSLSSKFMASA